jgi:hypothetical protein
MLLPDRAQNLQLRFGHRVLQAVKATRQCSNHICYLNFPRRCTSKRLPNVLTTLRHRVMLLSGIIFINRNELRLWRQE